MTIKIISNTVANGIALTQGSILHTPDDLSEADAKTLILYHRAIEVDERKNVTDIADTSVKEEQKKIIIDKPKRRYRK